MISDLVARMLLQRLLSLMAQMRTCKRACIRLADSCNAHEQDWKRLERDVKKALGEPGAN